MKAQDVPIATSNERQNIRHCHYTINDMEHYLLGCSHLSWRTSKCVQNGTRIGNINF